MLASDVLDALRRYHADAAIVSEVVMRDWDWLDRIGDGGKPARRIDALMFKSLERTAIEIKVSKADFARDVHAKRYPWQRVTHRFVYAVPADIAQEVKAPYGCGLWVVEPYNGSVTVAQKAKINRTPEPLPQQVVQSLAYRAAKIAPAELEVAS